MIEKERDRDIFLLWFAILLPICLWFVVVVGNLLGFFLGITSLFIGSNFLYKNLIVNKCL